MADDLLQKQKRIQFDFQEAMNRAKELEDIARQTERVQEDLGNAFRPLRAGWEGEGSESFLRKGGELGEQIGTDAKALRRSAEEVRRIARIVRKTELANLQLAISR